MKRLNISRIKKKKKAPDYALQSPEKGVDNPVDESIKDALDSLLKVSSLLRSMDHDGASLISSPVYESGEQAEEFLSALHHLKEQTDSFHDHFADLLNENALRLESAKIDHENSLHETNQRLVASVYDLLFSLNNDFVAYSLEPEDTENQLYLNAINDLNRSVTRFIEKLVEMLDSINEKKDEQQPIELKISDFIRRIEDLHREERFADFIQFIRNDLITLFSCLKNFQSEAMAVSIRTGGKRKSDEETKASIIRVALFTKQIQMILNHFFHNVPLAQVQEWIAQCIEPLGKSSPMERHQKAQELTAWFIEGTVDSNHERAQSLQAVMHCRQVKKTVLDLITHYHPQWGMDYSGNDLGIGKDFRHTYEEDQVLIWFYENQNNGPLTLTQYNIKQCTAIGKILEFMGMESLQFNLNLDKYNAEKTKELENQKWNAFFDVAKRCGIKALHISFINHRASNKHFEIHKHIWQALFNNLPKGMHELTLTIPGMLKMSDGYWLTMWDAIKTSGLKSLTIVAGDKHTSYLNMSNEKRKEPMLVALEESGISLLRFQGFKLDKETRLALEDIIPSFSVTSTESLLSRSYNTLFTTHKAELKPSCGNETDVILEFTNNSRVYERTLTQGEAEVLTDLKMKTDSMGFKYTP